MVSENPAKLVVDPFDGIALRDAELEALTIRSRKALALLAYLGMRPGFSDTRERIAGLLWSESTEGKARSALRQCLRQLRLDLGNERAGCLKIEHQRIALDQGHVTSRAGKVLDALKSGRVDPLLLSEEGLPERLFYGFEDLDPGLTAWLRVARQAWRGRLNAALDDAMQHPVPDHVPDRIAEALSFLDPSHEPAQRRVMMHHARSGNPGAAIRQYERLWHALDVQHDAEPMPETVALIADIKRGDIPLAEAPRRALVPQADPQIAPVIELGPFNSLSPTQQDLYTLQGFRSELLASLTRFREWSIIEGCLPETKPDYVIDADLTRFDVQTRFILFLRDARSGRVIWSETYGAVPRDFGEALRRIVRRVALALNIYLSAERVAALTQQFETDWAVFDRWLYGQSLSFTWQPDDRDKAKTIFRQIVADAPDYTPAYVSLVMLENTRHLAFPGCMRSAASEQETLALARRALAMDPLDTKTHLAAAWSMTMNGRFAEAQQYFAQSYDLNPSDPWTIVSAGLGLAFSGALSDGMALAGEALQLDQHPSPSHCEYQANIHFLAGDYEMSRVWGVRAQGATRDSSGWQVACLAHLGRSEEACLLGKRFVEETRMNWHGSGQNPSTEDVAAWFLHCFPLADREGLERLRTGLTLAGLTQAMPTP
ncbi:hypothetical protein AB838_07810 [Rhodobacteraceae bacterium (ex Bugula neritina AB1)]|nr:hypothetical protein AB838_07810 [Rhodobacteraceae bacterium (ex Bugula neritina AB1)]